MVTNEDKYRITLNKITEALATKPGRNSDEDYVLKHVKAVLLECEPDVSWWWNQGSKRTKVARGPRFLLL